MHLVPASMDSVHASRAPESPTSSSLHLPLPLHHFQVPPFWHGRLVHESSVGADGRFGTQDIAPVIDVDVPGGQRLQALPPESALKDPTAHSVQEVLSVIDE